MVKKILFGVLGALTIYLLLMSWHEKDKKVDALTLELNKMYEVLNEKEQDRKRDEEAIAKRDREFEEQNKRLISISANLRKLAASNQEMRDMLNMRIPPELLRSLKTYSTESKTAGSHTTPAKATDRK